MTPVRWSLGEPTLRILPTLVPTTVSPAMGEHVSGVTPLVWRSITTAKAYLLELQCYEVSDENDVSRPDRFTAVIIPSDQIDYKFDCQKLPRGKWRWRVHALGATGFLGESGTWMKFVSLDHGKGSAE